MDVLHLLTHVDEVLARRLTDWDAGLHLVGPIPREDWAVVALGAPLRGATISASTGIEGNPLTPAQVDDVLAGTRVRATEAVIREVANYSAAVDRAEAVAHRVGFEWSEEVVHQLNATLMRGLPGDTVGEYRSEPVNVGGFYTPPDARFVPNFMRQLVDWLRRSNDHPLVRVAILHLNFVAIHPFIDGNGRTARILASLELMRAGVATPDLLSVEAYLRAHTDEYFDALRTTLGPTFRPEDHAADVWVDYYTRIAVDRLRLRNTILQDPLPRDIGTLVLALQRARCPTDWAPVLLAARLAPIRTSALARAQRRSSTQVREALGAMSDAGWLVPVGATRGRRYQASPLLEGLPLRVPDLMAALIEGTVPRQLSLWEASSQGPGGSATFEVRGLNAGQSSTS